jgi:amino acid adenylation domain-containing protein
MEQSGVSTLNPADLPLSLSQREVWLDQCAWPESTHLNIGGGGYIKGYFERAAFVAALTDLVAENEALRLVPGMHGRQMLLATYQPVLEEIDFSASVEPESALRDWLKESIAQPFNLGEAPPWRFALLRFGDTLTWLSIQFHHLIMDGWGTSQVMRRWVELYNARISDDEPPPANDPGYLKFVEESLEYHASKAFEGDRAFWQGVLPVLPLPLFERRHSPSGKRAVATALSATLPMPRADYDRLGERVAGLGVTPFSYMIAVLALYFARVQGHQEVVVGIPSLNRGGKRYKNTFGMFVGVFPLVLQIRPEMTVAELIAMANSLLRAAVRHQRYPLSELGKHLQAIRHKRDSLFDVLFSFERQDYDLRFGETAVSMGARQVFSGLARYPLGITLCEFHPDQDVELTLEASASCFEKAEVDYLGRRLIHLMTAMLDTPDCRLDAIDILPPAERHALVHGDFQGCCGQPLPEPFFLKFEQQAQAQPEAIALVWDGGQMNYATLSRQANEIAYKLREIGAGKDKIIALALERSPEMVAAILGVAKSGAAFLPLDVDAPLARLDSILEDSNALALLIQERNRPRFGVLPAQAISIDNLVGVSSSVTHQAVSAPGDLAYVLFTSGSTGRPKGVMVEHSTLAMRLDWLAKTWAVNPSDRTGQVTQLTFDPSLIEILLPLTQGASIALSPVGRQLPESLGDFALRHAVTIMALVPSTVRGLVDSTRSKNDLCLRVVCTGGEVLPPELAQRFVEGTKAQLYNVYGPTETAIFSTAWLCSGTTSETPLPVGLPISESRVYILDQVEKLLPFGVLGEVFIGGRAIARGYLNRPDLDVDAFRDDPFRLGQRMYRTGDRGWLGADGNLHFQGRLDRQIKLRGYRVELGEIEAALLAVEGVRQAAVKLVEIDGRQALYAWVAGQVNDSRCNLREALAARLPDYMLPAGISLLPDLPSNSTGKIDYEALPAPQQLACIQVLRPPLGRLECALSGIWEKALNRPDIGVHDNFFDVGGDSLAAVEILTGIEQLLGRKISLYRLTEHPSIEQLAIALGEEEADSELMIPLNRHTGKMPLYLAASGHGDLIRFQGLAEVLGDICDFYMLQPPTSTSITSIDQLAELYAEQIESCGRPGFLAGFSVGGIAALETARKLQQRGMELPGMILVDTVYPGRLLRGAFFWRSLGWLARRLNAQELSMNGRHLGAMFSDPGLVAQIEAMADYRVENYSGFALLIKSSGLIKWERWLFAPWRKFMVSSLNEVQISGLHGSIFEKNGIEELAMTLRQHLLVRVLQESS